MNRLKAFIAVVAALAATIAGLDLSGLIAVLPPDVARVLVIVPSAAAVVVHLITATNLQVAKLKEGADKTMPSLLVMIGLGVVLLSITSCVTTTATDGSQTKRFDPEAANPFLLLARDLFADPPPPVPAEIEPAK